MDQSVGEYHLINSALAITSLHLRLTHTKARSGLPSNVNVIKYIPRNVHAMQYAHWYQKQIWWYPLLPNQIRIANQNKQPQV